MNLSPEEKLLITSGPRPTADEYFMAMAMLVATRSTCVRRQVGCVLVDENKNILATDQTWKKSELLTEKSQKEITHGAVVQKHAYTFVRSLHWMSAFCSACTA